MANPYAYPLAGGMISTFTVTPSLRNMALPEHVRESESWLVRELYLLYSPALRYAVAHKYLVVGGAGALLTAAVLMVPTMGLEFLPKLEEGNLWIRATMPSTISLEEGNVYV